MPKLLFLVDTSDAALIHLTERAAAGARTVRFAEVDVRHAGHGGSGAEGGYRIRMLGDPEELAQYDGIALGVARSDVPSAGAAESVLARFEGALTNKVGSAFAAEGDGRRDALWRALGPMADRGMILVPDVFADGASDAARLGARLAEVVGWVTHARSHHHHHH
jgi:hypothetical protein